MGIALQIEFRVIAPSTRNKRRKISSEIQLIENKFKGAACLRYQRVLPGRHGPATGVVVDIEPFLSTTGTSSMIFTAKPRQETAFVRFVADTVYLLSVHSPDGAVTGVELQCLGMDAVSPYVRCLSLRADCVYCFVTELHRVRSFAA